MIYFDFNGRLGADAVSKESKNGNKFVSMRVASNDYVGGENVTTWINVLWSGDRALKMLEYMKKGTSVIIRGVPRFSLYSTKEGEKAISIDVFADRVDFLNNGSGTTQSNESVTETGTFKNQQANATQIPVTTQEGGDNSDDDLPF
jgi:single stranded DNA-binding protein